MPRELRLELSQYFRISIKFYLQQKKDKVVSEDPVAVSGEATGTSVTPLKTRRNVSRGMASSSAPVSGRKSTWEADAEGTFGATESLTGSAAVTAPTVVECTLIKRTSPAFFFFSLSRQKGTSWPVLPQALHSLPGAGKCTFLWYSLLPQLRYPPTFNAPPC